MSESNIIIPNKAPIVVADINELGDKRLNDVEGLARIKEENIALAQKNALLPGQKQLEDKAAAVGKPMEWRELVRKLELLNAGLWVHDGGYPNAIAVHVRSHDVDGAGTEGWKYVTGFMKEVLNEYSYVKTDDHGRPTTEVRGWRSVLMMIIKQKLTTFAKVRAVFGDAMGQRSNRWHEQLQIHKN